MLPLREARLMSASIPWRARCCFKAKPSDCAEERPSTCTMLTCSARASIGSASPSALAAGALPSQAISTVRSAAGATWTQGTIRTGRPVLKTLAAIVRERPSTLSSACSTMMRSNTREVRVSALSESSAQSSMDTY